LQRGFAIDRANKVVKFNALIKLPDGPHKVLKITQGKRGKGGGFVKAKLQHLFTLATFEKTFTSDESVEEASFEKTRAQFSWTDGDTLVFLDSTSFEEIRITKEHANTNETFKEGEIYKLLQCEGKYIGIDLVAPEE
jgi:elongation factor P